MFEELKKAELAETRRSNLAKEAIAEKDRYARIYGDTAKASGNIFKLMGKNDYSFYGAYDDELKRLATAPMSFPNSQAMPFGTRTVNDLTPKAIIIDYRPTLGQAGFVSGSDIVGMRGSELSFEKLYTALLVPNTGYTSNYTKGDIGKYVAALDSLYLLIWKVLRAIGIINYYDTENVVQSAPFLVKLMGFDYLDMKRHLTDYIDLVNSWIQQLSNYPLPLKMTIFSKHSWLEGNLFRECDSEQGKVFFFNARSLLAYDINSAAMVYEDINPNALKSLTLLDALFNGLYNRIARVDDFRVIAKDMIRLAKSEEGKKMGFVAEYPLTSIDYDFCIAPYYDETALMQFENANYFKIMSSIQAKWTSGGTQKTDQLMLGYKTDSNGVLRMQYVHIAGDDASGFALGTTGLALRDCIPVFSTKYGAIVFAGDLYNWENSINKSPVYIPVSNGPVVGSAGTVSERMATINNLIDSCGLLNFDFNDIHHEDIVEATREKLVFNRNASNSIKWNSFATFDSISFIDYSDLHIQNSSLFTQTYNLKASGDNRQDAEGLLLLDDFGDAIFEQIFFATFDYNTVTAEPLRVKVSAPFTSFNYIEANQYASEINIIQMLIGLAHSDFDHSPKLEFLSESYGNTARNNIFYPAINLYEAINDRNLWCPQANSNVGTYISAVTLTMTQFSKRWRYGVIDQLRLSKIHKWCIQSEFGAIDPSGTFGLKEYGTDSNSVKEQRKGRGNRYHKNKNKNKGSNKEKGNKYPDPKDKDKDKVK